MTVNVAQIGAAGPRPVYIPGTSRGPAGPAGPQGDPGPQGSPGLSGPSGFMTSGHGGPPERIVRDGQFIVVPTGESPAMQLFVAPASGSVRVDTAIRMTLPSSAPTIAYGGFEVREGLIAGQGTVALAYDDARSARSTAAGVVTPYSHTVTGLTPGALYHARLVWIARPVPTFPLHWNDVEIHERWISVTPA